MSGDRAKKLARSRRRLLSETLGITLSALAFGLVYGLAARGAGLSALEVGAMSVLVFAGAAQFAALGSIHAGAPWLSIILVTAFINGRHLLYGAALAPWVADRPRLLRAAMAHVLDDETFALAVAHFRRIGRTDLTGYWIAALLGTVIPWIVATLVGATLGGNILEPQRFGLDIIFPAAMAGLAVGLITERRELVAAVTGAVVAVAASLAWDPAAGIVIGGIGGSLIGLALPVGTARASGPDSPLPRDAGAP